MPTCGLDFGTSNTTLGRIVEGAPVLVPLEESHTTIPSAIFYATDGTALIGRSAIASYIDGSSGRLMRSLKSILGTSLIDEVTQVGRERSSFRDVIAAYLGVVKRRAEQATGREFRSVVHGRPVHFVDGAPEADRDAQQTLHDIARGLGFDHVTFQLEPIAAALDYERRISTEEIALIADIGGGTSDFSIVRLSPERHRRVERQDDVLANDGVRLGGTDFDRALSLGMLMPHLGYGSSMKRAGLDAPTGYFHDLATWSLINKMYAMRVISEVRQVRQEASNPRLFERLLRVLQEQRGHTLAMEIEAAKITLSGARKASVSLSWIEPGLDVEISRSDLVTHTRQLATKIAARIKNCLTQSGLRPDEINTLFLTGGSAQLAHVRSAIIKGVPAAQVIDGDTFGAVGKGLTIEAARRFGTDT